MPLRSFKSLIFRKINLYFDVNFLRMEWTELYDLNLCEEVLVVEPWKHPYCSKERGDSWNEIANNLNASDHPTFKVLKRSVRDRLTLLQQKYKAKMRMEEAASGIDCQETKLDKALEEIIEKEKAATKQSYEAVCHLLIHSCIKLTCPLLIHPERKKHSRNNALLFT